MLLVVVRRTASRKVDQDVADSRMAGFQVTIWRWFEPVLGARMRRVMNHPPDRPDNATGTGTVPRSPAMRARALGAAARQGNQAALSSGFHELAAEPGNRYPTEVSGLAGLGAQLLDFGQTQGRSLTAAEQDFAALLIRKIGGLLEAVDGEQDDLNLPAWRARLTGLCPAKSPDPLSADQRDSAVWGDETESSAQGLVRLNRDLNEIFSEEFSRQLSTLEALLETLQQGSAQGQSVDKIQEEIDECVHTISGNCRNLHFDELAVCVEASLTGLTSAHGEAEFQSVYADFRHRLALLRTAWQEITETGTYSSALAARLVAAGASSDPPRRETGDDPPIMTADIPPLALASGAVAGKGGADPELPEGDVRSVFLAETESILGRIGQVLQHWQEKGPSDTTWSVVRRELHSLKGAVTAVGRDEVSHFIHDVETFFAQLRQPDYHERGEVPELLADIHRTLLSTLGLQASRESPRLPDVRRRMARFLSTGKMDAQEDEHRRVQEGMVGSWRGWMPDSAVSPEGDGNGSPAHAHPVSLMELIHASGELDLVWSQLQHTLDATRMNLELLRVGRLSIVEGLQAMAAEAGIETGATPRNLMMTGDLAGSASLQDEHRHQGFRELSGRLSQLEKVEQELVRHASDLEGVLTKQRNLGDRLKSGLKGARMVSLGDYLPHLRYLVREIAKKAGKEVDLRFEGGDLQIDRLVIESMMTCFGHLIRNAVVHGIESSAERQQAGKVPRGTVVIRLSMQGSELMVRFSDDGSGLPMDRILARAMEQGWVDPFGQVSQTHMLRILTQPGFSTAPTLQLESGRGMGLDIVYQAVRQMGGSMQILSSPGGRDWGSCSDCRPLWPSHRHCSCGSVRGVLRFGLIVSSACCEYPGMTCWCSVISGC